MAKFQQKYGSQKDQKSPGNSLSLKIVLGCNRMIKCTKLKMKLGKSRITF